jgi:hypothetical protein
MLIGCSPHIQRLRQAQANMLARWTRLNLFAMEHHRLVWWCKRPALAAQCMLAHLGRCQRDAMYCQIRPALGNCCACGCVAWVPGGNGSTAAVGDLQGKVSCWLLGLDVALLLLLVDITLLLLLAPSEGLRVCCDRQPVRQCLGEFEFVSRFVWMHGNPLCWAD